MIYIFLDIDGVLVKEGKIDTGNYAILDEQCVKIFEFALTPYSEQYKIVISSAWREIFNLDFIKSRFSPELAKHIVGCTPFLKLYADIKFYRYQEILQYLQEHDLETIQWIAIDDIKEHYPPSLQNHLIHTNCYQGFCFADAFRLRLLMDNLSS